MKKILYLLAGLALTANVAQAQVIPMPKPGPAPKINVGKPETFTLPNGLTVMVVENHKLPRVSYSLTMDNAPYAEGNKKGVANMTSALMGTGSKNMPKDKFNEEVDQLGADVNVWGSGAAANGLSKYSGRILELMAEAALYPVFTQEEFDKQKNLIVEDLKSNEKNVPSIARRVKNNLVYGKNHPNGEYLSEETLNNVTLADVKQNYDTYFVPGNAYLVVVGDVKFKDVKKQVTKLFGNWTAGKAPSIAYSDPKDVQYTQINFVDMPNAVQSEISVLNVTNLKMTDKEYFATIIGNQILGGGGGKLFLNLREKHGWTYGSYSSIGGDKYVGNFGATASVRNAVTDSAIVEMLNEIKNIRTNLVSPEDLENAKAKYIGSFVMQIQKPATVARYALLTQTQALAADFYENYIKNINAVTAEDIRAAAQKFFFVDNARIVVVGKAADVLPGLEKTGIPINYFDKWGKAAEKPVTSKPIPAGVTAKTVLDNYIKAIGGEKAVKAVKSIYTKSTGKSAQIPAPIVFTMKVADHKQLVDMTIEGYGSVYKQVVNDKAGYRNGQAGKEEVTGDELKELQASAVPFEELGFLTDAAVKLTGIEAVNGTDAYVVKKGTGSYYYDVATGLKIGEAHEEGAGAEKQVSTTYYSDYKEVKGVKVPHHVIMNIGLELDLTVKEAKINEGVSATDFQ
ncbi:peptidase M16 [Flavobacterium akiainvivens]|uniref:Peptidase M16 n=1 Tax=Flavobacterium akiainvivens TaxID=1202724 RepID=A0A0M8MKE9_9FLAO|nr:insulinase family protein [Flavobacterium akiainvivens]KOS07657.1 peptidase M16 [Flavobacterium akiainvivens]SFQ23662.1 Predicted Zn-dependent peptidase [Flavobacterium akiainvivens]